MKAKNLINAVIFDMDGVILDSEPLADLHLPAYLKKFGIVAPNNIGDRFRGVSNKTLCTSLKKEYNLKQSLAELMADMSQDCLSFLLSKSLEPMPGLTQFIELLLNSSMELAVGSSGSRERIHVILDRLKLKKHFTVIISATYVTEGKPAPDIFLLAAKKMGFHPTSCMVIEDSTNGVLAAKRAGMKCIGYAGSAHNKQDLSGADLIIKNFADTSVEDLHRI